MLKKIFNAFRRRILLERLESCGKCIECDPTVNIVFPERVRIEDYVYIGPKTYLNARGGLLIGSHSIIAPEVVILTSIHNYKNAVMVPYDEVELLRPVNIERCVWIGMRAIIMPGVTLGEGSIIAAGAVVTKSCSPGSILGGNPAKVIGQRNMEQYFECVNNSKFYLMIKHNTRCAKREIYDGQGQTP